MNIKKMCVLFLCVSSIYAENSIPKLIIHVNVNKTIMAEDPAAEKSISDEIIGTLAEDYESRWDSSIDEPITYKQYVHTHLVPGAYDDQALNRLRNEQVTRFIEFLAETNHPWHKKIQKRYARLMKQLKKTGRIYPSFFHALRHLDSHNIPYSIVLRTHGNGLDHAMEEFDHRFAPHFFSWKGAFNEGILTMTSLKSGETVVLQTTKENLWILTNA